MDKHGLGEEREPYSVAFIECTNKFNFTGKEDKIQCIPDPEKEGAGKWDPTPKLTLCETGELFILLHNI